MGCLRSYSIAISDDRNLPVHAPAEPHGVLPTTHGHVCQCRGRQEEAMLYGIGLVVVGRAVAPPCPAQHPVLSLASLEGAFPQCNLFWPHVSRLRSNGSCMPAHPPSVCCLVRLSSSFSLGQGIHSLLPFVPSEPLLGCSPRRETEWFLLYQEESQVRLVWCSGTSSGPWVSWIPCCLLDLCGLSCISMVDRKMRHKQICLTQGPTWTAWHKVR